MKKGALLYEGKAKKVFETDDPDILIVDYKDDATAFNGQKKGSIAGKGEINNRMSNHLFMHLEKALIKTHFIKEISKRETAVKRVKILPLEVIVRNFAAGSFSKRYGIEEGTRFDSPTVEFSYKNDALNDPLLNDSHAVAMKLATNDEIEKVRSIALMINDELVKYFDSLGLTLADFKLEFGRYGSEIILADEISPDTCRLWDKKTGEKLDKDRFRQELGNVEEAYREVFKRLGLGTQEN